jgi:hypothetical protein
MSENNIECLNCHKADKNLIKYLEDHLDSKKVFVGFIKDGIIGIQVSADLTYTESLLAADTIKHMAQEF